MADLTITIPDDQIATMEKHLDPAGETGADAAAKTANVQAKIQQIVSDWVWDAAKQEAANAVANPSE